jgi:transposase
LSGVQNVLKTVFPDLWIPILDLASYLAVTGDPAMYCKFWQDNTLSIGSKKLTSQRISELLFSISEEKRIEFYSNWAEIVSSKEYLALDCSSVSTYSEFICDANWDYNKYGDKLPQVNLCMLAGEESRIPVFPLIYEGSIKDVSILRTMIETNIRINSNQISYAMDRYFASKKNIDYMLSLKKCVNFLISLPFTSKFAKTQVDSVRKIIDQSQYTINTDTSSIKGLT